MNIAVIVMYELRGILKQEKSRKTGSGGVSIFQQIICNPTGLLGDDCSISFVPKFAFFYCNQNHNCFTLLHSCPASLLFTNQHK